MFSLVHVFRTPCRWHTFPETCRSSVCTIIMCVYVYYYYVCTIIMCVYVCTIMCVYVCTIIICIYDMHLISFNKRLFSHAD